MVEVLKAFNKMPQGTGRDGNKVKSDAADTEDGVKVTRAGWVAPQYAKSRKVVIDPVVASANRCMCLLPDYSESTHYKMMRTQTLQQLEEHGWNTLMITSASPGEGKTVTAVNLAAMFAREFSKTALLVDADLRQQTIHRYLGYKQETGLVEHLLENVPMEEIIAWPGIEKLTIISGGRTIDESAELLNSPRMRSLIQDMRHRYADRYIFFDVPAISGSTDAVALAPLVDGILVVVQAGRTPMIEIQKSLSLLPKEKILGLIMNRIE